MTTCQASPTPKVTRPLLGDSLIALAALIWGASLPSMKFLSLEMSGEEVVFWRFSAALLFMAPFALWRRSTWRWEYLTGGLVCGAPLSGMLFLGLWAMQYTSATRIGFLFSLYVIFVPLLVWAFTGRRPPTRIFLAACLALGGVYFLAAADSVQNLPPNLGDLMAFGGAILGALQILAIGHYCHRVPAFWLNFVQVVLLAVCGLVWCLLAGELDQTPTFSAWKAIIFLSLGCTIVTFWAQITGQVHTTSERAAVIFTLEPAASAMVACWLLGELMGPAGLLGSGLILGGVLMSVVRPRLRTHAVVMAPEAEQPTRP